MYKRAQLTTMREAEIKAVNWINKDIFSNKSIVSRIISVSPLDIGSM